MYCGRIVVFLFSFLCLVALDAFAEGSFQTGLNQPLLEKNSLSGYPQFVDIATIGEVINVSVCGEANADHVNIRIFDPDSTEVLDTTLTSGNVSCTDSFTAPLTNPVRYITTKTGAYEIWLNNVNESEFYRYDISITPDAVTDPDPSIATGRLWAYQWGFFTHFFAESSATDADYYPLVPGGRTNTNYVWKLDLNKFSGNKYILSANDIGVDAPNSGYSVLVTGNTLTPKFPIYLAYPAVAKPLPTDPPIINNFRFIDNASQDYGISPGVTANTQDSGDFEFSSDVDGTYSIIIDINLDGVFGAGDRLLFGNAHNGFNQVNWDGKDASGAIVSVGTYSARLQLRLGEYHFIANDAETSGGGVAAADGIGEGLTIFLANSDGSTTDTLVYWDDTTLLGGSSTLPNGELSSSSAGKHTWGDFTSSSIGNETYIDTYVYGLASTSSTLTAITGDDDGLTGADATVSVNPTSALPGVTFDINVTDADLNLLASTQESALVVVSNFRTGEVEQLIVTESNVNSSEFITNLATVEDVSAGANNDGSMNVQLGDFLTITYVDQLDELGAVVSRITTVTFPDTDGDEISDLIDLDDDNDGIPDNLEGSGAVDSDGDGITDSLDLDSDNDGLFDLSESGADAAALDSDLDGRIDPANAVGSSGLANIVEVSLDSGTISYNGGILRDTDVDTVADFRDLDSDNDGIPDTTESGGSDPEGNGELGNGSPIVDSNGVPAGGGLTSPDTDGDGTTDQHDLDADNDGITDLFEAGEADIDADGMLDGFTDTNNNGLHDALDSRLSGTPLSLPDSNADGTPDYRDNTDSDADGLVDSIDLDADNDGITNDDEGSGLSSGTVDTDSDGIVDSLDLDSDNDGLFDLRESGATHVSDPDTNNDGRIDDIGAGDTNGLADALETVANNGIINYTLLDTDADTVFNFRDLDSDNDGIADVVEAGGDDSDGDGIIGTGIPTVDADGVPANGKLIPADSDNDGVTDPLDLDTDGDGLADLTEANGDDADNNGLVDSFTDLDGNGMHDELSINPLSMPDSDTDGIADVRDLDSDNDGIHDVIESQGSDPDGDAMLGTTPQSVDANGIASEGLTTPQDTDSDNVTDQRDLDSDNDGIPDVIEAGGSDADNDGLTDGLAGTDVPVVDNRGLIAGAGLVPADTDVDGQPDNRDLDSDDDGAPDLLEVGGDDIDNNGRVDSFLDNDANGYDDLLQTSPLLLTDSDADGIPDYRDNNDSDNDGIGDYLDLDDDNDGIPDSEEGPENTDTDSDGVVDRLDLDSDNDGLFDLTESGADSLSINLDTDNNGRIDAVNDVGSNGLADLLETSPESAVIVYTLRDTDGDVIHDYRDRDSDNDGLWDIAEVGGSDPDRDGTIGTGEPGVNQAGIAAGAGLIAADFDDDGIPNQLDLNSDNDGIPDVIEAGGSDPDGDGIAGIGLPDVDAAGVPQVSGGLRLLDRDGDGQPDTQDLDADGDNIFDLIEAGGTDLDADGKVDNFTDVDGNGFDDGIAANTLSLPDSDSNGVPDYQDMKPLITGLSGFGGCTIGHTYGTDPTLPLLLIASLFYLGFKSRHISITRRKK